MSARSFLDTNVFVYAVTPRSADKMSIARDLIDGSIERSDAAISYQVVQEFVNVALSKFAGSMSTDQVRSYMSIVFRNFDMVHSSLGLCSDAMDLHSRYRISWYDSLIVAAAVEAKCNVLYTEDMQHAATIAGVRITNPFIKN